MRVDGSAATNGALRVGTPTDPKPRDEMFDETTAASIVSALRRWTGSSSSKDAANDATPVTPPSVVQNGLEWSDALKGIAKGGTVELNALVENLSETLEGARVSDSGGFEEAAHAGFGDQQPLNLPAKLLVPRARFLDEARSLIRRRPLQSGEEDRFGAGF